MKITFWEKPGCMGNALRKVLFTASRRRDGRESGEARD